MTHATSSTLPSLGLPPSGLSTAQEPHPDSEEFVRHERRRVASELDTIQSPNASLANPSREPSTTPSYQHYQDTRSRGSDRNPSTIWRRTATPSASDITTIPDSEGPEANDTRRYRLQRQATHWYDPVVRIWTSQISITIDEGSHRDHLALERTFLGYLRTSLMLTMTGVIIAQLFRVHHSENPNPQLGFFVLGVPLAATFVILAIIVLLIGAFRFWRQQNALVRGMIHAGGWEISTIMLFSILLCVAIFILVTAIDIERSYN